jgi:hypothetical protein
MNSPDSVRKLAPPFPLRALSADDEAWVADAVDAFALRHPIYDAKTLPLARELTLAWFRHCCPPHPSRVGLELSGIVLFTWYWFHEHQGAPDYADAVSAFWEVLGGRRAPGSPLERAALELRDQLRALPGAEGELHRFWFFFERTLSAFVWNAAQRGAAPVPVELYEAQRTHTIFVQPWVELWRVAERRFGIDHLLRGVELERFEEEVRRHHYLANDLCSLGRDVTAGKQSMVRSIAAEEGIPVAGAAARCEALVVQSARDVVTQLAGLQAGPCSDDTRWYLEFLCGCARGNVEVMARMSGRYGRVQ